MKTIIIALIFIVTLPSGVAEGLKDLLLEEADLPKDVTFMKASSVTNPEFLKGKNRVVFSDDETLRKFCAMFLRDESFASKIDEISLTACHAPINDAQIVGHRLKDAGKVKDLKKAYGFLISKVKFHEIFESGNLVFIVWSNDEEAKKWFDALARVVREKLETRNATEERAVLELIVVKEESFEDSIPVSIKSLDLEGFRKAKPDLLIKGLKDVWLETGESNKATVNKDGTLNVKSTSTVYNVTIELYPRDQKAVKDLSARAKGKRLLMKIGEIPLIAPYISGPLEASAFQVSIHDEKDANKMVTQLKKLVSKDAEPD